MSRKQKEDQTPMWAKLNHGRPVSRRELLATGLISFSAYLILPSWLSLVSSTAEAQAMTCPTAAGGLVPFLTVNLSGGAALQANFIPHDQNGQLLANYDRMGLGNNGAAIPIEREFGNVPFAGNKPGTQTLISQFLAGVRSVAPTAIPKTAFVAVCTRARDDFAENKLSTSGLLAQAGLQGTLLPYLGSRRNATGISQAPAVIKPPAPLLINSFAALAGSIVPASDLPNFLSNNQRSSLLSLVSKLSTSQVSKLSNDTQGTATKTLLECANIKNEQVKAMIDAGAVVIDPRKDSNSAALNSLWKIDANTRSDDQDLVYASMTYNILAGNSGAAGLELGGYDYHDNTRTTADKRDFEAGVLVGRALETAAILGKKLFIHVCTDGAVDSGNADNTTFNASWSSDRGTANVGYILYYDPAGRAATSGFQINSFTSGQIADESAKTGSSEGAAVAVFANYLKLNKRMDLYSAASALVIPTAEIDKEIKFA